MELCRIHCTDKQQCFERMRLKSLLFIERKEAMPIDPQ